MRGSPRRLFGLRFFVLCATAALALTSVAAGAESDSSQMREVMAENLVEIKVADRAAIDVLMKDAEAIGAEFNDHYLRQNHDADETLTVQVLGSDAQIAALRADGYEILATIEDSDTYWERIAERLRSIEAERNAYEIAREGKNAEAADLSERYGSRAAVMAAAVDREITVNRVDYFENYAGRFLSVEAWDRDTVRQTGGGATAGQGPTLAVTWNAGGTTAIGSGGPRSMTPYIDPDPAQDTYLYHRMLIRIGAPNDSNPPRPTRIRIASSTGAFEEADVNVWTGAALPPHVAGFQRGFHTRYMDPTEIYAAFNQLATEYPNIAHMVNTPYKTNGYQRRAQATLAPVQTTLSVASAAGAPSIRVASQTNMVAGATIRIDSGANQEVRTITTVVSPNPASPAPNIVLSAPLTLAHAAGVPVQTDLPPGNQPATAQQGQAVIFTSTAWGHQGGNDTTAELRNPNAMNSPLAVTVTGKDILVSLATGAAGELTSTATDVINAVNANPAARALAKAHTYRNNTGTGIAQPRAKVNLSDFLTVSASVPASGIPHDNSHVQRGPFQPQVMRIGKTRDNSKVGVYLFCEQHAREWVTPITCYETAAELLKNYATDPQTREIVDNLEIFILPVVNPDGAHYSFYNFQSQRKNMTNHCVDRRQDLR